MAWVGRLRDRAHRTAHWVDRHAPRWSADRWHHLPALAQQRGRTTWIASSSFGGAVGVSDMSPDEPLGGSVYLNEMLFITGVRMHPEAGRELSPAKAAASPFSQRWDVLKSNPLIEDMFHLSTTVLFLICVWYSWSSAHSAGPRGLPF